jgi:transcriptional regulator with PAS, ATPase and Fis domain
MRILFAWIGQQDLNAASGDHPETQGPIRRVVEERPFDRLVLLSNYAQRQATDYVGWLRSEVDAPEVRLEARDLTSPTDFGEIHEAVVEVVTSERKTHPEAELVFHVSPGTPAMAAVWIILAKTRFPAELVQSSPQAGVQTVSFPYEISAEFLPDLLRKPDRELAQLHEGLPPEAPEFEDIVHRSGVMKSAIALSRRMAVRNIPILIEGESGTGKELFARAIRRASPRAAGPFQVVNCGAIPAELIDSELFGHERGAFTGAERARAGVFEEADGGTLFLDEIGELPLSAQVRLLRVLQEGEVTRVGSTEKRKVDVRVIAATNRNLRKEVDAGRFREDLYHRVAVGLLTLPPIRERGGDLGLLVDHLLERIDEEARSQPGYGKKKLAPAARNLLLGMRWPGNVRELRNVLVRATIWSTGDRIEAADARAASASAGGVEAAVLGRPLGDGFDLRDVLADTARHYLARAMEEADGNKTRAAELVGLPSYQTLTNWLEKYGVGE